MNTYRVWLSDGNACLENALTKQEAILQVEARINVQQPLDGPIAFDDIIVVDRVERLS